MSQLHSFINVLQPAELAKIKKSRLIGKESKVFEYILSYRQKELPEVEAMCRDLEITSTHYYKICSVLMDKFYDLLIPQRGYDLLYFLNRKDLYSHFTHEMLMQEKQLMKNKSNPAKIEIFYLKSFELLQRVSAKNLDEELILSYGEKYLKSKVNVDPHDKFFVRSSFIATKLYLLKATKKDKIVSKLLFNELQDIAKSMGDTPNIAAKFQLNRAYSIYYNYCVNEPQKVVNSLSENIKLIKANPTKFTEEELVLSRCKIAEMYYMDSKFDAAFKEYSAIFVENEVILSNDFYHHAKFAQVAMITEQYDFAKELLEKRFQMFIDSKQAGAGTMGCLLFAKLYLILDPQNQANKYIQLAKKLINKSFYIQYEYEVRILENMYFMFQKDLKTSKSLVKKNLKFMNSKGLNLKNSEMIYVLILLQEILKPEFKYKKLNNRLNSKFELLQRSYAAIYGKLIGMLMHIMKEQV